MKERNQFQEYKQAVSQLPESSLVKAAALRTLASWEEDLEAADPYLDQLFMDALNDLGIHIEVN